MMEFFTDFRFLEPAFLYLLIPLAILFIFWVIVVLLKRITRPAQTYGSKYPIIGRVKLWGFFVIPAGALMVLALAKPHLDTGNISFSRGDVEVILAIDRSISMRANDVRESRLEIAKREAMNIESLLSDGDKLALFVFGRESHRKIFLTKKHASVFERISDIDFPSSLTGDGLIWDSDFASMLENIYQSMDRQDSRNEGFSGKRYSPKKRSNRIVILMSDGEDQFRKDRPADIEGLKYKADYLKRLDRALNEFRRRGIKIYPVGIGTTRGASWLSLLRGYEKGKDYSETMSQDWRGQFTKLDKNNLSFLARSSGTDLTGYIWTIESPTTTVRSYIRSVLDSSRNSVPEFGSGEDVSKLWQYFLLAAVIILTIGILSNPITGYFRRIRGA